MSNAMKLRLTSAGSYHGFKGLKEEAKRKGERERAPKGMFAVETSREVGSDYSVNDLLKDGSRRRGPLR